MHQQHCQHHYRAGCEDIAAIPLKSCDQCSHFRGGYCYGFGVAKQVFSTAEAILCGTFTPLGQVQIGPLDSLSGQLVLYQIPDGIISTLKLADLAVSTSKLANAVVTAIKIANSVITNAKIDPAAAILESKLNLNFPTHDNALDHAEAHTLASHSTKAHSELTNVLTSQHHVKTVSSEISLASLLEKNHASLASVTSDQHHPQSHTLASHSTKAHSELTNVTTSQHHVKFTGAEAVAAVEGESSLDVGNLFSKTTAIYSLGSAAKIWKRLYLADFGIHFGATQDVSLYRSIIGGVHLRTDDEFDAGGGLKVSGVTCELNKIYDLLMYGSGNEALVMGIPFHTEETTFVSAGGVYDYQNTDAIDDVVYYAFSEPTNKRSLKLYCNGFTVDLAAADVNDYLSRVRLYGVDFDTLTLTAVEDNTDRKSAGSFRFTPVSPVDLSSFKGFKALCDVVSTTAGQFQMTNFGLWLYYT